MALAGQLLVPKAETSRTNRELKLRGRLLRPFFRRRGQTIDVLSWLAGGKDGALTEPRVPPRRGRRGAAFGPPSPLRGTSEMMVKVTCTCGHVGIVSAESLPRSLTCTRCGSCRRVEAEDGTRIVNRVAFEEWLLGAPRAQSRSG